MAGAHCATFPFRTPPICSTTKPTKPILSAPIAIPSKPTGRKNYLRPKILKTLAEPDPPPRTPLLPEQPLTSPVIPIEVPVTQYENDYNVELSSDQDKVFAGEGNKVEEFSVSETTPEYNGIVGKLSAKSVLKFGAYLVGAYLFQAFFTVWLLGNDNPDEENRKAKSSGLSLSKGKVLNTNVGSELGNVVYLDELQLDEKVEEIRAMAREARKHEKKKGKGSVGDEDDVIDESSMPRNGIGIEKEVGEQLVKLQKGLNSKRAKLHGPYVKDLGKPENSEDQNLKERGGALMFKKNLKEGGGALMFKKKLKFKAEAKISPKGFGGLEEHDENRRETDFEQSVSETLEEEPKLLQGDGNPLDKGTGKMDGGKDLGAGTIEPKNGTVQRTRRGRSSEGVKSKKSRELGKKKSRLKKQVQETTIKSGDHAILSVNGSLRHKKAEKEPVPNKVSGNRSKNEIDPWWLDLPYVLVILIHRGSGSEGQGGLYTLKLSSQPQNQRDSSYTVAFEDHADANNFCFLLESLFEDLGDFSADIVPLPNKELREAIKSDNMKVIFVKKGQLPLYAGQPFEEVEMALRSLVEHD